MIKRLLIFVVVFVFAGITSYAQYNTDRLLQSGELALENNDYVVAIQHCNNIISNKPYLYKPWFYRGIAKKSLGDYVGAEDDFDEAVRLNPYVHELFAERAGNRLNLKRYSDAIDDYTKALKLNPDAKDYWFNRAWARFQSKDVKQTRSDLEYIIKRWPDLSNSYGLMTETYLNANDTASASKWLERTLRVNPYDGNSWSILGRLNLQRKNWRIAEDAFSKAIHYSPKVVNNYTYRAMARVNLNRLRNAMEDYDKAIDMDPNNFISHYNRGLLRQTLGDDNRAINDFSFVLRLEPNNLLALYNRAILLDKTGNYRSAILDYTRVINKFPNFWSGLLSRAKCYRRLGMNAKAELDEFRVFKAQMNKHLGLQQRWSRGKLRQVRKLSDIDVEKYDQWVVQDSEVTTPEYKNEYRGYVQNREVTTKFMPMFILSYQRYSNGINNFELVDKDVEAFNTKVNPIHVLYITCRPDAISETDTKDYFNTIQTLTDKVKMTTDIKAASQLLLQRAVAYSTTYNYEEAINDLNDYLTIDSMSELAYWQRAVCLSMVKNYDSQNNSGVNMMLAKSIYDFKKAIDIDKDNAYLYYDLANVYSTMKDYKNAIANYDISISRNSRLAEAYYNRGIAKIFVGNISGGLKDLGKAGELGIYDAYALMKKYSGEK